jgi:pilus assembly protein Flp/PilA
VRLEGAFAASCVRSPRIKGLTGNHRQTLARSAPDSIRRYKRIEMKTLATPAAFVHLQRCILDNLGVTAIEYGLVMGLIAVAIITVLTSLGTGLSNIFNTIGNTLSGA